MLKLSLPKSDIPNLLEVTISSELYYFQGDFEEIRRLLNNQLDNFYPYQDTKLVNDIKAFDRSSIQNLEDHAREIVSLAGFTSIEIYQEPVAEVIPEEVPALTDEQIAELERLQTEQAEQAIIDKEYAQNLKADELAKDLEINSDESVQTKEPEVDFGVEDGDTTVEIANEKPTNASETIEEFIKQPEFINEYERQKAALNLATPTADKKTENNQDENYEVPSKKFKKK